MLGTVVVPLISALLGVSGSNVILIYLDKKNYKKELLQQKYNHLYLPFYKFYILNNISEIYQQDINEHNLNLLKNLNEIINNNFQYLTPKLQTDFMYFVKSYYVISKFKNYNLNETAFIAEEKIITLNISLYNSILLEYCKICRKLKLEAPIYKDISIKPKK